MPTSKSLLSEYRQSVKTEFIVWAKLPLETKFSVSLVLIITALALSGYLPTLGSALNVWGLIIFFEAILQERLSGRGFGKKELLKTYLFGGILGAIAGSFLLIYFDILYYTQLAIFDYLTRYIWFLIPHTRIRQLLFKKN